MSWTSMAVDCDDADGTIFCGHADNKGKGTFCFEKNCPIWKGRKMNWFDWKKKCEKRDKDGRTNFCDHKENIETSCEEEICPTWNSKELEDETKEPMINVWRCSECHLRKTFKEDESTPSRCPVCDSQYHSVNTRPVHDMTFDTLPIPEKYHVAIDTFEKRLSTAKIMMKVAAEDLKEINEELFVGLCNVIPETKDYRCIVDFKKKILTFIGKKND